MKRTTILADQSLLEGLRRIARKERMSLSATIRRALEEFVDRRQGEGTLPSFLGIGRSGRKDIAERVEDLLRTTPHRRSRHEAHLGDTGPLYAMVDHDQGVAHNRPTPLFLSPSTTLPDL